jgi:hypothetical protein
MDKEVMDRTELMQLLEQHVPGPRLVPGSEALHGPPEPDGKDHLTAKTPRTPREEEKTRGQEDRRTRRGVLSRACLFLSSCPPVFLSDLGVLGVLAVILSLRYL